MLIMASLIQIDYANKMSWANPMIQMEVKEFGNMRPYNWRIVCIKIK
jgi:hypothetical protein